MSTKSINSKFTKVISTLEAIQSEAESEREKSVGTDMAEKLDHRHYEDLSVLAASTAANLKRKLSAY